MGKSQKNIEQAHPPGKKFLQDAGYLEKKPEHMKLGRRSSFLSKWI